MDSMQKRYLVIGSWIDKTNGKPVTRLAEINSGLNKNGDPYELADTEGRDTIDGTYPVGTILTATMNLTVQEHPEEQRGLKLGASK